MNCAIRRIHNRGVWYLYSCAIENNKVVWTKRFVKAHQFLNHEEAMDFARIFLGTRAKECDTLSEYETWSV